MSCGCRTAGLLGFGQGCPQLLKAALNVLPHGPPNMTSRCVNASKRERCLETWVVPSCVITYTKSLHAATLPYSVWLEATYEASLDSRAGNHSRACTQKGRSEGVHPRRLSAMYDVQWLGRGDGAGKRAKRLQPIGRPENVPVVTWQSSVFLWLHVILGNWPRFPTELWMIILASWQGWCETWNLGGSSSWYWFYFPTPVVCFHFIKYYLLCLKDFAPFSCF